MRIFLDANILFSAAKSNGAVRELLGLLAKARHELWADGYVVEEARRNLAVKAPDGVAVLETLLTKMHLAGAVRIERELEAELALPEKDRPILAAAIHCGCEALVTGDSTHFGALYGRKIRGVAVHSPRSIAQALFGTP
jgi:predicted nucleic acid-binding protein